MEKFSESEELLKGQAQLWQLMFAFADSMALKCAVELRVADIINSHGSPISMSQLCSAIDSSPSKNSAGISYLTRIMRLLVRRNIFKAHHHQENRETLYGLTNVSKWLLHDSETSLAPMVLLQNHPLAVHPWNFLSQCVKEGGFAFEKANGYEIWEFGARNSEFNAMFNGGMASTARVVIKAVLELYREGFGCVKSMVDVGGGTGALIAQIVKSHPHIKGINFDLPHVVETAPFYDGVSHVGGDMFEAIPHADVVIMKTVLHDWNDENCIKILKNCRKSIPEETGKILIIDMVLKPEGNNLFDDAILVFDIAMIAHSSGGKERNELEWKKLLEQGGFPRYNIIQISTLTSVIEAFPR